MQGRLRGLCQQLGDTAPHPQGHHPAVQGDPAAEAAGQQRPGQQRPGRSCGQQGRVPVWARGSCEGSGAGSALTCLPAGDQACRPSSGLCQEPLQAFLFSSTQPAPEGAWGRPGPGRPACTWVACACARLCPVLLAPEAPQTHRQGWHLSLGSGLLYAWSAPRSHQALAPRGPACISTGPCPAPWPQVLLTWSSPS